MNSREKGGAITAVVAIHVLLLLALLNLSGKIDLPSAQSVLRVIDLGPLRAPTPHRRRQRRTPKPNEGGSAPKNVKSEATPVFTPKPRVQTQQVPHVTATATPRNASTPTQGASPVPGPGTGSGGSGNGTGSGTGGSGSGNDGDNEVAEPPRLATPVLSGRDIPRELLKQWPRGGTIFLRLRVDPQGYVAECLVDRGTGVSTIDTVMCNLAHDRLRFHPALNRSGQAVAGWFGYAQPAPR